MALKTRQEPPEVWTDGDRRDTGLAEEVQLQLRVTPRNPGAQEEHVLIRTPLGH